VEVSDLLIAYRRLDSQAYLLGMKDCRVKPGNDADGLITAVYISRIPDVGQWYRPAVVCVSRETLGWWYALAGGCPPADTLKQFSGQEHFSGQEQFSGQIESF
jgi:hypothetical protein